ncbi:hypothetical protein Pmani_000119 [Petrolisthes manimaculis]|uniref:Uncharacterized protein n=1 Tax=Petrolisthes manimaculis TaxID=1843537 RepID=A0AAE1UQN0_9EUCA|nr:hypothetical protein Pmani_000119 [Petrolisthes manimaculis]
MNHDQNTAVEIESKRRQHRRRGFDASVLWCGCVVGWLCYRFGGREIQVLKEKKSRDLVLCAFCLLLLRTWEWRVCVCCVRSSENTLQLQPAEVNSQSEDSSVYLHGVTSRCVCYKWLVDVNSRGGVVMSTLSLAYPWLLDAYPELLGGSLGSPLTAHHHHALGSAAWGSFDSLCPMAYQLPDHASCLGPALHMGVAIMSEVQLDRWADRPTHRPLLQFSGVTRSKRPTFSSRPVQHVTFYLQGLVDREREG